jgi:hypothetical protein
MEREVNGMRTKGRRIELVGWALFTLCAVLYSAANIRARDWLSLAGSILFFLACIVFICVSGRDRDSDHASPDRH